MQNFLAGFLHELGARVVVFVNAVTKTHQLNAGVFVFDLLDEVADFLDAAVFLDVAQHVERCFIGAAVGRAPETSHAGCNGGKRVGAR